MCVVSLQSSRKVGHRVCHTIKNVFPQPAALPLYFCNAYPSKVIYPQRKISSWPHGSYSQVKDLWLVFYDSCSSIDLYHDYIPTVLDPHARLDSYFCVMFDIMVWRFITRLPTSAAVNPSYSQERLISNDGQISFKSFCWS